MAKVAFITGVNGITGSNILEHLVKNTSADQWGKIIISSRSPLVMNVSDPRVQFIALDFLTEPKDIIDQMKDVCKTVTHAYFSSYIHKDDFEELNSANQLIFENFLTALLAVAPELENVTLQTGGKHYGLHLMPVPSPTRESDPRPDTPIDNFYYPQEDFLIGKQKGQKWKWNVIRPMAIVGTTPKPNGMNTGITLAAYILICKKMGTDPKLAINQVQWNGVEDASYAPLIADLTIWASTNPKCGNEAFNSINGDYFCWKYMWPRLCAYFGVTTSSDYHFTKPYPTEGETQQEFTFEDWANDPKARKAWDELCDEKGCPEAKPWFDACCWQVMDWVMRRTWVATSSFNKARKFGYTGHIDSYDCFINTFEKYRELKQLPPW